MRRLVIFFLLCVLPLQFALAAAVDATLHAGGRAHHGAMVQPHEMAALSAFDAVPADESSSRGHADCGGCQCVHAVAILLEARDNLARPNGADVIGYAGRDAHHCSAAAMRPERPNWAALV